LGSYAVIVSSGVEEFEGGTGEVRTTPLLVSSAETAYWRRWVRASGLRQVEMALRDGCARLEKVALAGAHWSWREHWRRVLRNMTRLE
jgi:hypothetical protein